MDLGPIVESYLATLREKGYRMSIKRLLPGDQNVKQKSFGKDSLLSFHHGFQGREQMRFRTRFF
jgi:limonene-1,2-epoxide hydrolase